MNKNGDELRDHIAACKSIRDGYSDEFKTALSFAGLEIAELKSGTRSLKDCPGLDKIFDEMYKLKTSVKPAEAPKDHVLDMGAFGGEPDEYAR